VACLATKTLLLKASDKVTSSTRNETIDYRLVITQSSKISRRMILSTGFIFTKSSSRLCLRRHSEPSQLLVMFVHDHIRVCESLSGLTGATGSLTAASDAAAAIQFALLD
jgi:hypothetical protein